jgi:hypothetical protein
VCKDRSFQQFPSSIFRFGQLKLETIVAFAQPSCE